MTGSVGDVVALLLAARTEIAAAAVTASRAQADAAEAHSRYAQAGQGGDHPKIRRAIAEAHTAQDKSAKVARLFDQVQQHIANYVNAIAPGAAPAVQSSAAATPEGETLVSDAQARARKGAAFLRASVKGADDRHDALAEGEDKIVGGLRACSKCLGATLVQHMP